jgi:hypothetical protein
MMSFNAWDGDMPVTEARLRNRCLTDDEHMEIEEEIIRRIRARLCEYLRPEWIRPALIFVAHFAGVAPSTNILGITQADIKRRNEIIGKRAGGIDSGNWQAHMAYADLVADAGRFAKERIELIEQRTTNRNRCRLQVAASSSSPKPAKAAWAHEERRAGIRRVV